MTFMFFILAIYAPWHDAYTLGQRGKLTFAGFSYSIAGVVGLVVAFIFALLILLEIYKNRIYLKIRDKLFFLVYFGYLLISTINLKIIDKYSLITLFHVSVVSLWCFYFQWKTRWHLRTLFLPLGLLLVFSCSYFLSLVLPLVIEIKNYSPFIFLPPISRFRGWTGEGQPIAWCGLQLVIFAALKLTDFRNFAFFQVSLCVITIILGCIGIYANVSRATLILAVFIMLFCFVKTMIDSEGWKSFGINGRIGPPVYFTCSLLLVFAFFTGKYSLKNTRGFALQDGLFDAQLTHVNKIHSLRDLDKIVVLNGRAQSLQLAVTQLKNHWIFGRGPGAIQRLLQDKTPKTPEPNNDYLRLLYDFGLIGIVLFILNVALTFSVISGSSKAILLCLLLSCSIDAIMVIPIFGYLLFFLNMFWTQHAKP